MNITADVKVNESNQTIDLIMNDINIGTLSKENTKPLYKQLKKMYECDYNIPEPPPPPKPPEVRRIRDGKLLNR